MNETGDATLSVIHGIVPFLAMLPASLLLDATVRPRRARLRDARGILLQLLVITATFGFWLAASGSAPVAAVLATAAMALFAVASNAKHKMLGEPLVFSDLTLLAAMVQHPRFYFTALSARQRAIMALGAAAAVVLFALVVTTRAAPHLAGAALVLLAAGSARLLLPSRWFAAVARTPDLDVDLARYGLTATLLLYWWRWRRTPDPAPCPTLPPRSHEEEPPELIVVIQCESFADPVELTGDPTHALPGLAAARAAAWQWGELEVSGFGAYTMRTEYGVLFGRSETALGFRRFDPFLSARGETSYALSARLREADYRCAFVHPHDMRFYNRDRLMPAIGFDRMIGEEAFAAAPRDTGRYVGDRALGAALAGLVDRAAEPTLLYAVTMENHGPWDSAAARDPAGRLAAYLRHLRNSDAMLEDLMRHLAQSGRPALLAFFGDHRPSIPGVTAPGGARHTPYAIVRFDRDGAVVRGGPGRSALSPAGLHHAILRCVRTGAAVLSPREA